MVSQEANLISYTLSYHVQSFMWLHDIISFIPSFLLSYPQNFYVFWQNISFRVNYSVRLGKMIDILLQGNLISFSSSLTAMIGGAREKLPASMTQSQMFYHFKLWGGAPPTPARSDELYSATFGYFQRKTQIHWKDILRLLLKFSLWLPSG
jgi:hypothetical protein